MLVEEAVWVVEMFEGTRIDKFQMTPGCTDTPAARRDSNVAGSCSRGTRWRDLTPFVSRVERR